MLEFETRVVEHQLEAERRIAEQYNLDGDTSEVVLVICDRGIVDAYGYLNKDDRAELIKRTGIDLIHAWSRYDAVMFLETADSYENDSARTESKEEAQKISEDILSVWMGHPHLRYIKSEDAFEEKFTNLKKEIKTIMKAVELEKKYLIEYPNLSDFEKYKPFRAEIEQIYLTMDIGSHRIRKRGHNGSFAYYETLKLRLSGDKCIETQNVISEEMYEELKKEADPDKHPIVKDRYCFLYEGQYFEMDIYPFWNDKAVLELEITSRSQEIKLPPEIKVIKDVSKSRKYKNSHLARNV